MKKMIKGKKYRIEFNDGCVDGFFVGEFQNYLDYSKVDFEQSDGICVSEIPDHDHFDAVFDIGHIGPGWGNWNAELID